MLNWRKVRRSTAAPGGTTARPRAALAAGNLGGHASELAAIGGAQVAAALARLSKGDS